jgi:flagellin
MRINTNIAAMNSYNQLKNTQNNLSKSLSRLSSGKRINGAADDAAGLAISEKMNSQTRGLAMAQRNAQDGISMIQTAEGALKESHSILQRMRELSVQSANDTNTDADRAEIQKEVEQLTSELNRIGETTEFNTKSLLKGDSSVAVDSTNLSQVDGELADGAVTTTEATQTLAFNADMVSATVGGTSFKLGLNGNEINVNFVEDTDLAKGSSEYSVDGNSLTVSIHGDGTTGVDADALDTVVKNGLNEVISGDENLQDNFEVNTNTTAGEVEISATKNGDYSGDKGYVAGVADNALLTGAVTSDVGSTSEFEAYKGIDFSGDISSQADIDDLVGKGMTINDQQIEFYDADDGAYEGDVIGVDISDATTYTTLASTVATQLGSRLDGVTVHQGDGTTGYGENATTVSDSAIVVEAKEAGTVGNDIETKDGGVSSAFESTFQIGANSSQNLKVSINDMRAESLGVSELDLSTREGAEAAIDSLDEAIASVSGERSKLGAVQNRLDHTINNLNTAEENLTAAESRISDVDMAKEMMNMSKQQILSQAGTAMLAQANQLPQGVLQLLG